MTQFNITERGTGEIVIVDASDREEAVLAAMAEGIAWMGIAKIEVVAK